MAPVWRDRRVHAIVWGALALRLAFVVWVPHSPTADGLFYDAAAKALLNGAGYVDPDGSPAILWLPGWPAVLALLYAGFGADPAVGMFANAVFGAATVALLIALGSVLFSREIGLLAGLVYALWPGNIYYVGTLYTEPVFNFVLALVLLAFAAGSSANQARARGVCFLAGGVAMGLAAWLKAEPLALVPVVVATAWVARRSTREFFRLALATLLVTFVVIGPWLWRNHVVFDRWMLSAGVGVNLWVGNRPGSTGGPDWMAQVGFARQHMRATSAESTLARHDAGRQRAWKFIRENPAAWLAILVKKVKLTYQSDSEGARLVRTQTQKQKGISEAARRRLATVADVYWFALLMLTALGVLSVPRWSATARILLFGLVLSWLAIHLVMVGGPRFHVPETLAFSIFAACGLQQIGSFRSPLPLTSGQRSRSSGHRSRQERSFTREATDSRGTWQSPVSRTCAR